MIYISGQIIATSNTTYFPQMVVIVREMGPRLFQANRKVGEICFLYNLATSVGSRNWVQQTIVISRVIYNPTLTPLIGVITYNAVMPVMSRMK